MQAMGCHSGCNRFRRSAECGRPASHILFTHEQGGMPAERVAQLEKAAALSPELKTVANSNHTLSMTDGAAGERVGE